MARPLLPARVRENMAKPPNHPVSRTLAKNRFMGQMTLINTSFVERLNLSLRQRVVAMRRRSASPCKSGDGLRHQLVLFQVYHNFVLPHASLRHTLAEPIPTNGSGSAKVWRPWTPAMAAGLTDHVWSLTEVLLYRVPPWPQAQMV